ncbi:MAG TPA: NAD(+)/NADH kinase [Candidatus Paceibacterota bacterium]
MPQLNSFHIFYIEDNERAVFWCDKIKRFIKSEFPKIVENPDAPDVIIVLGGDGTILSAVRKYHGGHSIILGLNLGGVGFLASVRDEDDFLRSLGAFFAGSYRIVEQNLILADVERGDKKVFTAEAFNEVIINNPLGMVELEARIEGHSVKHVRGTGLLVSTSTGSTAYNMSAHGPIVVPDINCFVITEVLGHGIPSPSLIIKPDSVVDIEVVSFRKKEMLSLSKDRTNFDVLFVADGNAIFPLEEKDRVIIRSSPHLVKFAELEENYFFKSLKEKFGFK